jgi:hypothetical protein
MGCAAWALPSPSCPADPSPLARLWSSSRHQPVYWPYKREAADRSAPWRLQPRR